MSDKLADDDESLGEDSPKVSLPRATNPPERPERPPTEEATARLRGTAAAARPLDEELRWGSVGRSHSWGLLSGDAGEEGVIRIVEAGVVYVRPPREVGLREWQQAPGNPQRFEMPWSGKPRGVKTLAELGQDLSQTLPDNLDDPRLGELDGAVKSLLQIVGRLHEHGFRLGLLHPRNILILPGTGGQELVLPDYGFIWKGGPFRPAWMEGMEFKALWDSAPEVQQQVIDSPGQGKPLDPTADIRTLARLFACVLTGTPAREVPDQPPARSCERTKNLEVLTRVWRTLAQASRGEFQKVSEFAAALDRSPLSQHVFTLPPPPPPPPEPRAPKPQPLLRGVANPTRYAPAAAGAGILLALLFALVLWQPWRARPTAGATHRPGPRDNASAGSNDHDASTPSGFPALQKEYLAAGPEQQAALLRLLYEEGVLSTDPDPRRQEEAAREELRRDFLQKNWLPRYRQAEQLGQEDLSQRFVAGQQIRLLQKELQLLQERPPADPSTDAEEKKCLTFSGLRATELGSVP